MQGRSGAQGDATPAIAPAEATGRTRPRALSLRLKYMADAALMHGFDRLYCRLARPLLRHITGHWPRPAELSSFRHGYRERQDRLPPLLNALASTERLRPYVIDTMLAATRTAAPTPEQAAPHRRMAGTPIAFMHIEKTAGTSLTRFLELRFSPLLVMPLPPSADEAMARARAPDARAYTILHGHFDLPFLRSLTPERRVFTFLREPTARLLSCYYYWRSRQLSSAVDDVNGATVLAGQLGLLDFLRCDRAVVVTQIDNLYARRLTGEDFRSGRTLSHAHAMSIVDRGLAALDSLAFTGIMEQFPQSLDLLSTRFGLMPPLAVPRINMSARNAVDLPQDSAP